MTNACCKNVVDQHDQNIMCVDPGFVLNSNHSPFVSHARSCQALAKFRLGAGTRKFPNIATGTLREPEKDRLYIKCVF